MKKFYELCLEIQRSSLPRLIKSSSPEIQNIISWVKQHVIYICWNNFFYFQNWTLKFQTKCVTSKLWYWEDFNSNKTPRWLHIVRDFIWDWYPENQKFIEKKPTKVEEKPSFWEYNFWIYSRIITLDWLETLNQNTLQRNIYIHWNIHNWFWETWELEQSFWCIWLKTDEMIFLFDLLKWFRDRIFVFIEENT